MFGARLWALGGHGRAAQVLIHNILGWFCACCVTDAASKNGACRTYARFRPHTVNPRKKAGLLRWASETPEASQHGGSASFLVRDTAE